LFFGVCIQIISVIYLALPFLVRRCMLMNCIRAILYLFVAIVLATDSLAAPAPILVWSEELDSTLADDSNSVSGDGIGSVYTAGSTGGNLARENPEAHDGFVSKFDTAGSLIWTRQVGAADDHFSDVSADALGNVFVTGYTTGSVAAVNDGNYDALLLNYDPAGNLRWSRQIGSATTDYSGYGVSADGLGNVYISGRTRGEEGQVFPYPHDAFVAKYDAAGNRLWMQQIATSDDDASLDLAASPLGDHYVAGYTWGTLGSASAGSADAFVTKFDAAGNPVWTRQHGGPLAEFVHGSAADSLGNVFVAGTTQGGLSGSTAGSYDAFVLKYDSTGDLLWARQFGTADSDSVSGVSTDQFGNVILTGYTGGSLAADNAGGNDVFVSKYSASGELLWAHQFGTSGDDSGSSTWTDGFGSFYLSGTVGDLGRGSTTANAFVAKFTEIPEPATYFSALVVAMILAAVRYGPR
jgi:hypothetical protein